MMRYFPMLGAAIFAVTASVLAPTADGAPSAPAQPQADAPRGDDACLQNNRLWSWQVVNPRTLSITDRTQKKFTVRIAGGCVGLNNAIQTIEIRGLSDLSCVRRGDFVRFVEPNLGRMSCAITSVERTPEKPTPTRDQFN